MAYINYDFYVNDYQGDVPEEFFNRYEAQAQAIMNQYTFNRIEIVTQSVKWAMCELVDDLYGFDVEKETRKIKSEKVGDHSVTYVDEVDLSTEQTRSMVQKQILFRWLPSYLMFRGV